ncbi:MAG: hypothetical protein SV062_14350 [Thermodesulfobacteriota bacterium]|nr:hypothetical protein [Thermodesulfobacteriota bacterium]
MFKVIIKELKNHAPFTLFGAFTGIIVMLIIVIGKIPPEISCKIFYILHPAHVVLSALVTTAMYRLHKGKIIHAIIIGYLGSIGIATLSDIIFPYLGGLLLQIEMELHFGFIEKWWLVNPLAFLGIALGILKPATKIPHSGHVLLSTWASLFYLTAFGIANWIKILPSVFLILFFAVWTPCCVSDIVFPLLFVKEK